jgi:hypothetical protein
LTSKGAQGRLGATDSGPRPGRFPLGSAQSRAAARALLLARKATEEKELFRVVYRADGSVAEIRGLAEQLRAAIKAHEAGDSPARLPAIEGGPDSSGDGRPNCLAERIRMARERVARMQAEGRYPLSSQNKSISE